MEINNPVSFGESLLVMVVGICVVFAGLVILIALIKVLAKVTENMGKKKTVKTAAPAPAAPVAPAPVVEEKVEDDAALIAVISAAVACMMEENTGFVVRRVRRITSAPAWQKAGREEQIYSHF